MALECDGKYLFAYFFCRIVYMFHTPAFDIAANMDRWCIVFPHTILISSYSLVKNKWLEFIHLKDWNMWNLADEGCTVQGQADWNRDFIFLNLDFSICRSE